MNEENTVQQTVVNVDGKDYDYESLPDFIKQLVQLYHKWNSEYQNTKTETMKLEFALAGLSKQISAEVLKANDDKSTIQIRDKK